MKMIHPEIDAVADCPTVEGFRQVWQPRGWVLLGDAEAFASEVLAKPVKSVDKLVVEELRLLISLRGLEEPAKGTLKPELQTALLASFGQPAADAVEPDVDPEPPADTAVQAAKTSVATAPPESGAPASATKQN